MSLHELEEGFVRCSPGFPGCLVGIGGEVLADSVLLGGEGESHVWFSEPLAGPIREL